MLYYDRRVEAVVVIKLVLKHKIGTSSSAIPVACPQVSVITRLFYHSKKSRILSLKRAKTLKVLTVFHNIGMNHQEKRSLFFSSL